MQNTSPDLFQIDEWRFDCNQNIAWLGKRKIRIEPKAMAILQYLSSRPGEVVSREELFQEFWPRQVVTEDALNRVMSNLRRMFNDNSTQPKYIATIRKVGYKLVAPVTVLSNERSPQKIEIAEDKVKQVVSDGAILPENLLIQKKSTVQGIHSRGLFKALVYGLSFFFILLYVYQLFINQVSSKHSADESIRITYDKPENLMPDFSPDGKSLVYVERNIDGHNKLILRKLTGTYNRPIGSNHTEYYHPKFSPDGKTLALIAQNKITNDFTLDTFDLKTDKHYPLVNLNYISDGISWHPETKYIAFSQPHINQVNNGIYLWDILNNKQLLVTSSILGVNDIRPLFSPEGNKIAFVRKLSYREMAIFVSDLNGTTTKVTPYMDNILDFDWIDKDNLLLSANDAFYRYSLAGEKEKIPLTKDMHPATYLRINTHLDKLLLSRSTKRYQGQTIDFNNEIGGVPLTSSQTSDVESSISSNGLHLAFVSNRTGENTLWHRSGNALNSVKDTHFDAIYDLVWSPDSTKLTGVVKNKGKYGILNFHIKPHQINVIWQTTQPINISGWKNDNLVLYSQRKNSNNGSGWLLKNININDLTTSVMSNMDIYQSRITPDKKQLIFINSSRQGLWRLDWKGLPEQISTENTLLLDRNWDVDNKELYGINSKGSVFKMSLDSGKYTEFSKLSYFSNEHRPQRLIYGFSATTATLKENDFWLSTIPHNSVQ